MRLSLKLDSEVLARLRDLARQRGTSIDATLNAVLREGLDDAMRSSELQGRFVVEPHAGGFQPGIDPVGLNRLADEIDIGDSDTRGWRV